MQQCEDEDWIFPEKKGMEQWESLTEVHMRGV